MPGNPQTTVYIGNLDDKVDERVLYEIMVQAGPVVDVYIPRDKETKRHKGYGFAEFTTEESAQYAISLFSGLVSLHKKQLRFSMSGQDKVVSSQDKSRPPLEGKGSLSTSPPESLSYMQRNHTSLHSPNNFAIRTVDNGFVGQGQRLDFSPLAHAQSYNAHLVALGQAGLRSQIPSPDYGYAYRSY